MVSCGNGNSYHQTFTHYVKICAESDWRISQKGESETEFLTLIDLLSTELYWA